MSRRPHGNRVVHLVGLGGPAAPTPDQSPISEVVQPGPLDGSSGPDPDSSGGGSAAGSGGESTAAEGSCPTSTELQGGDTTRTLSIGGIARSFLVHVPPGHDGTTRVPVVFDFHGLGGNSNQQKKPLT